MVELLPSKQAVAGSSPVPRSRFKIDHTLRTVLSGPQRLRAAESRVDGKKLRTGKLTEAGEAVRARR